MTDHDHDEYSTTPEFKLTAEKLTARLKQANLASKTDIANFIKKKTDFDNKTKDVTSNKNQLNKLLKKVKAISTKKLRKFDK